MPTLVDLLRHGDAFAADPAGDAARRLSPAGIEAVTRLAVRLATAGPPPLRIFTSPLARAGETAAIVAGAFRDGIVPEPLDALRPDREPADVVAALATLAPDAPHVLLVGHQPLLGDLAGWLTDGSSRGLRPGELVRIAFAGPPGRREGRLLAPFAAG